MCVDLWGCFVQDKPSCFLASINSSNIGEFYSMRMLALRLVIQLAILHPRNLCWWTPACQVTSKAKKAEKHSLQKHLNTSERKIIESKLICSLDVQLVKLQVQIQDNLNRPPLTGRSIDILHRLISPHIFAITFCLAIHNETWAGYHGSMESSASSYCYCCLNSSVHCALYSVQSPNFVYLLSLRC
ncbi:hypothetical protein SCA6_002784 [Theobroma cacao]